ncbi:MAG: S1 RNA-binding domain-containing protein [Actinomycetota bacterium]
MSALGDITHVVVDGSNIATEGRSLPSLSQLNDAVMAFIEDHPDAAVTVVVDATFGHRIDKSEVAAFEEGVSNNELVAPPAGAVGRGDAFVLQIADKANAVVLSNDSFQEFHGTYAWLFDEGRLVGGKPVPHVGWVFVARVPVRGPVSRKATAKKRAEKRASRRSSTRASEPMPVPTAPPPYPTGDAAQADAPAATTAAAGSDTTRARAPRKDEMVNELLPFLEFVEHHPVGTSVNATVASYSSHGAYITIGDDVRGYVPLRLMGDPAPTSARKVLTIDESITAVVVDFAPGRRSIDCALPDMAAKALADAAGSADEGGIAAADEVVSSDGDSTVPDEPPVSAEAPVEPVAESVGDGGPSSEVATAESADNGQARTKRARKKRATKKVAAKKQAAAKKTSAKQAAAKKTTAKKTAARKATANKPAKRSTAKKTVATQTQKKAAKQTAKKKVAKKKATTNKAARQRARTKTNTETPNTEQIATPLPLSTEET